MEESPTLFPGKSVVLNSLQDQYWLVNNLLINMLTVQELYTLSAKFAPEVRGMSI